MKTICIYPKIKKDNKYIENYVKALDEYNIIEFKELVKKPWKYLKIDYFHFNWYENIKFKSGNICKIEFFLKKLFIKIIKLSRKKVVWTFHNKQAHDGSDYSTKIINYMIKESNKILIHCKASYKYLTLLSESELKQKVVYVPHGNYIGNYDGEGKNKREEYNIDEDDLVYMFIGQIKPYKNIEILIESYLENAIKKSKLVIIGSVEKSYMTKLLERYGEFEDVIFDFKFINDNEMIDYIDCADIFVTPYNIKSSLNSGSIIMYFSYKKTVISSKIGTVDDINEDFYYLYDYDNEKNHKKELSLMIGKTINEYLNNKEIFKEKGEKAYQYVNKNYCWEKLKNKLKDLYL